MRASRCALLLAVAGCAFDRGGVGAPDAFVDPTDDGGGVPSVWRDDTALDFAATGHAVEAAIVEPWGAIGPDAWLTGGVLARAADTQLFTSLDGNEWALLDAAGEGGRGVSELAPRAWGLDGPRGMSLTSFDTYTYWAWGEVWLDEGPHNWALVADDVGFLEIAAPGSSEYTRVVVADYDTSGLGAYNVTTPGWHPFRIAVSEGLVESELELRLQAPGAAAPTAIPPDRLRSRAADATGLHWSCFEDSRLLAPLGELGPFLWSGTAIDYSPSNGEVTGLGFQEADRFSMRWAGQVRIDVAGAYSFRLESDDGQRLWIDGVAVLDAWDDAPHDQSSAPIALDVGWHDLVLDLTDNTGNQKVRLRAIASPDPALSAEIPADRLRPVPPRHERATGATRGGAAIPTMGEVGLALRIDAPDDAKTIAVELGVTITHGVWAELSIAVAAPDGTEYTALPVGGIEASGTRTERFTVAVPAEAARGLWSVQVTDTVIDDGGSVDGVELTVRHDGGAPPIAAVAVYQSPVEDLGDVVGFDSVSWTGRFPPGSSAQVRMRTCDAPQACADEEWSAPADSGDKPAVQGRRYAQYRVELASDGDVVPFVDAIEIAYRAAP